MADDIPSLENFAVTLEKLKLPKTASIFREELEKKNSMQKIEKTLSSNPLVSLLLKKLERTNSTDKIERNSIRRILTKKQSQFFNQSNTFDLKNDNNIDDIEQIKDFRADCILYDKNKKTYIGKLFVDQDYMIYFSPEINNKPKLYFNSDYYIFPLLSIAQCITNTNYFGQSKYCKEITLKDGRNFIFKFSPDAFEIFDELIEKFAFPKISKNYFNFANKRSKSEILFRFIFFLMFFAFIELENTLPMIGSFSSELIDSIFLKILKLFIICFS